MSAEFGRVLDVGVGIATLSDQMRRLGRIKAQLADEAHGQLSVTDRDARSMLR